jgi:nitroreductase
VTGAAGGITPQTAEALVAVAVRAPSVHNTQPWEFRLVDGILELWADPARRLRVADPDGREQVVSCGAALFTLRLAMRLRELDPLVTLEPLTSDSDRLARVAAVAGVPATPQDVRLFAAVHRRHTHRGPFPGGPASPTLMGELERVARQEGGRLLALPSPARVRRVADLVAAADRHQHGAEWDDEIADWTPPPGSNRRDGVPSVAYERDHVAEPGTAPVRDFSLGRGWGTPEQTQSGEAAWALLATHGDTRHDWLRAGQAVQAVLLRAAADWAFATIYTQSLELPYVRSLTEQEFGGSAHGQLLMRLGHAGYAPATPRRPVREVLQLS